VKAVTTPQTLTFVVTFAVRELGATSCPAAFNVPFRHRFAPSRIKLAPSKVVPMAMGKVCPPIVMEPGRSRVAAL
jgi:hypothetical protein